GRIGWSSISDHIGRPTTWMLFFAIQMVAFLALPRITNPLAFQLVIFAIMTCYGGGFASIPAYISDLFGTKEVSAIHGYILTAWSCAGIFGPMLLTTIKDRTQSYSATLYVFGGLFTAAFIVSVLLTIKIKIMRARKVEPVITLTNDCSAKDRTEAAEVLVKN
ncbi:MAG TPA: MFS transporter, partial [Ignavibacteriales bacterium]|nr:MFS transporter [Ignavibacteriales bacterium]